MSDWGVAALSKMPSARELMGVLGRWSPELHEHLVGMPNAMPIAMQATTAGKKESRAAAAIHFIGMCRQVAECDPCMFLGIWDGQNTIGTIYR